MLTRDDAAKPLGKILGKLVEAETHLYAGAPDEEKWGNDRKLGKLTYRACERLIRQALALSNGCGFPKDKVLVVREVSPANWLEGSVDR
jgi:hypothetical protein